jgi:hypothetical protein
MTACNYQDSSFSKNGENNTIDQGAGMISWSPSSLLITDVPIGTAKSGLITLTSVGDNNLSIQGIALSSSGDGVFYTSERTDLTLAPEQSVEVEVVAAFESAMFAIGELRVRTNDANNLDLRIPLCAVSEDYTEPYECEEESQSSDTSSDTGM